MTDLQRSIHYHDGFVELFLVGEIYESPVWQMAPSLRASHTLTTFVMIRDSRRFCWCSCGLSCVPISVQGPKRQDSVQRIPLFAIWKLLSDFVAYGGVIGEVVRVAQLLVALATRVLSQF